MYILNWLRRSSKLHRHILNRYALSETFFVYLLVHTSLYQFEWSLLRYIDSDAINEKPIGSQGNFGRQTHIAHVATHLHTHKRAFSGISIAVMQGARRNIIVLTTIVCFCIHQYH